MLVDGEGLPASGIIRKFLKSLEPNFSGWITAASLSEDVGRLGDELRGRVRGSATKLRDAADENKHKMRDAGQKLKKIFGE